MWDPFSRDADRKKWDSWPAGWVRRKYKNSDKWVTRWLEVNKHVLYSYQSCPADMPSARVMNMLDLRTTRTIDGVEHLKSKVLSPKKLSTSACIDITDLFGQTGKCDVDAVVNRIRSTGMWMRAPRDK